MNHIKVMKQAQKFLEDCSANGYRASDTDWIETFYFNDNERLTVLANITKAIEQAENKSKFDVLAITTAYEQGVGKGHQAQNRCVDIVNPYIAGDCFDAWELGYGEGKGQAAMALQG